MTQPSSEINVSVRDLLRFLLRGLPWALAVGAGFAVAAYLVAQRNPPVFRAEATLLVARTTAGFTQFGLSSVTAPPIDLSAYRAAAVSDGVLASAAGLLGVSDVQERDIRTLRGSTTTLVAGEGRDSSLLRVEARGGSPDMAVARANALAAALAAWDRRRATESLTRVIATLEQQIDALGEQIRSLQAVGDGAAQTQVDGLIRLRAEQQQQLAYARALVASAEGLVSVLQPADTTPRQVAPRPATDAALAFLVAVVLTYGLLLVRAALSTRLRSVDDIAASGLAVLAQFPRAGGPNDGWRMQEAAHYLRANLGFALSEAHPGVILVTSASEGEGKTTVACALAEGFARNGYRTLLVDADLRAPSVAARYGVDGSTVAATTTREWLAGGDDGGRRVLKLPVEADAELFVVPQFRRVDDAAEALGRGFAPSLELWSRYDVIVVDSSPVLAVADALAIAPHCTISLLVVDTQLTTVRAIGSARDLLTRVGANVLGVVANRVRQSSNTSGYGVSYGGGYGAAANSGHRRFVRAAGEHTVASVPRD